MSALAELIARVEGLQKPAQEVGMQVLLACGWSRTCVGHFYGPLWYWSSPDNKVNFKEDDFRQYDPTASIDAVVALIEQTWPDKERRCWRLLDDWDTASAHAGTFVGDTYVSANASEAVNPALALLLAFLRALESSRGRD